MKTYFIRVLVCCWIIHFPVVAISNSELQKLIDDDWQHRLQANPLFATKVGDYRNNDKLPQFTKEELTRQHNLRNKILSSLNIIKRDSLTNDDRVTYDILKLQLEYANGDYKFKSYLMPINADSGFHISFARLAKNIPLDNAKDYENYIARLSGFVAYVNQHIQLMRYGLKQGITQPKIIFRGFESSLSRHIVNDVKSSVFYDPFKNFPVGVPQSDRKRLTEAGVNAINSGVIRGYKLFLDFMQQEYIPNARSEIGASSLPNGEQYYAHLVRKFTTLDISPKEVHALGLKEVKRIKNQMLKIKDDIKFKGSLEDFIQYLRTDKQFYATSPDELLKEARDISKRMDAELPRFFKLLPRMPYGVEPVPDAIAPKYTTGRYVSSPLGSTEPGYYWVNTFALNKRPLYSLPALTLHEAVPGHHLQVSLARENANIPKFRRNSYIPAFGEGWGLYSEKLGVEAGIYRTPYEHFGRLSYEMWRACRLVVDTGIHSMGWGREQAMDYMAENTALSLHNVKTETDRYISWPGQALAYKMGELKILELREKAEKALGGSFDIRSFHDAVLNYGGVPLPILEDQINRYIAEVNGKITKR